MAFHLLDAVKALDIPPSHKLVMVAFADSADKDTRIAWPGMDSVLEWSCLKRSRALEVVKDLCQRELLRRIRGSSPGRRAEFLVLPMHTCPQCKPLPMDVDGSGGSDPSDTDNGSGGADPNRSDLADNGSDLTPSQVQRAGPLPLETPLVTPPVDQRATSDDIEGHSRVAEVRRKAVRPLGPGWTQAACTRVIEAAMAEVPAATRDEAWASLASLAAEDGTDSPGRLLHRLSPLQARVRMREDRARREAERQQAEAAATRARQEATPASANSAWQQLAARMREGRADRAEGAHSVPTPGETAGQDDDSGYEIRGDAA